jgi:hypothetical protein
MHSAIGPATAPSARANRSRVTRGTPPEIAVTYPRPPTALTVLALSSDAEAVDRGDEDATRARPSLSTDARYMARPSPTHAENAISTVPCQSKKDGPPGPSSIPSVFSSCIVELASQGPSGESQTTIPIE